MYVYILSEINLKKKIYIYIYIYVQNPKTIGIPVHTYTYPEFVIEIGGLNQHLTDTLRYHQNETPTFLMMLAAITSYHLPVGRKVDFTQSSSLFFKVTIAVPSSNSSIGMENNDEFMDCCLDYLETMADTLFEVFIDLNARQG